MENKYFQFIKNIALASTVCILTGVVTSKVAGNFTNNGKVIGAVSTFTQYTSWFGAFLPLHAADNRAEYTTEDGRFNAR